LQRRGKREDLVCHVQTVTSAARDELQHIQRRRRQPTDLGGARASKGIIFTASSFSAEGRDHTASVSPRVVLIDGAQLAALMIDRNVGVSDREIYAVKRLDNDYFGDESYD
jgi:hypothetical protein